MGGVAYRAYKGVVYRLGRFYSLLRYVDGIDGFALEIPFLIFRWSMKDPAAGAIDETGLFTAGGESGEFPDAISVNSTEARR